MKRMSGGRDPRTSWVDGVPRRSPTMSPGLFRQLPADRHAIAHHEPRRPSRSEGREAGHHGARRKPGAVPSGQETTEGAR